jgi:hypothetical protein
MSLTLQNFLELFPSWDKIIVDPWAKNTPYSWQAQDLPPDLPGVYLFALSGRKLLGGNGSVRETPIYYIGDAQDSLRSRLTGKIKGDSREGRAWRLDHNGEIFYHEYPYFPIYLWNETKLYIKAFDSGDDADFAEKSLIKAFKQVFGKNPAANREKVSLTGISPALLSDIYLRLLKPIS